MRYSLFFFLVLFFVTDANAYFWVFSKTSEVDSTSTYGGTNYNNNAILNSCTGGVVDYETEYVDYTDDPWLTKKIVYSRSKYTDDGDLLGTWSGYYTSAVAGGTVSSDGECEIQCEEGYSPNEEGTGCEKDPDCDEEYQAALDECGGDPEQVQTIDLDTCQFQCSPCIANENVQVGYDPVRWSGVTYQEGVALCASSNGLYSYYSDTCIATCKDSNCDQEYSDKVVECGGEEFVLQWNPDTCTGECETCKDQVTAAIAECGAGAYTIDENCNWVCNKCDELIDECLSECGEFGIASYSCDEDALMGTVYVTDCICGNDADVNVPTDGDVTGSDIKTSTTVASDGTVTSTTTTYTRTDDGDYEEVTTTVTDPDGNVTETTETTYTQEPDTEEGEEDTYPEVGVVEVSELDWSPVTDAISYTKTKVPFSIAADFTAALDAVVTSSDTPYIELDCGIAVFQLDFSNVADFASSIRGFMKWVFGVLTIISTMHLFIKD